MAKNAKSTVIDEDDEEQIPVVQTKAPKAEKQEEDAPIVPTVAKAPAAPEAKLDDAQLVHFSPFEDIDPAPVVGTYRFSDHGHPQILKKHKAILVPAHVAEHLVDRRLGQVIG